MIDIIMPVILWAFMLWWGIVVPVVGFACADREQHVVLRGVVGIIGLQLFGLLAIGVLYRACGLA